MTKHFVYPGSFCPPTRGHARIVERAAEIFPQVTVVCSTNNEKDGRWFSPGRCVELWQTYALPPNVSVKTLSALGPDKEMGKDYVMIRGVRDEADIAHEQKVMALNRKDFGINAYTYFLAEPEFADISSSKARALAESLVLGELYNYVSPLVISALLEKALNIQNLFMVVGRPGSGKSTFLKMLNELNPGNVVVGADAWSDGFKPALKAHFGTEDLIGLATKHDEAVTKFLKPLWLKKAAEALREAAEPGANIFVEVAYGLRPTKRLFRYLGGKVIYVGCEDPEENRRRNIARGTPELTTFINDIPNWVDSWKITKENNLQIWKIDSSGTLDQLKEKAQWLDGEVSHLLPHNLFN